LDPHEESNEIIVIATSALFSIKVAYMSVLDFARMLQVPNLL
jgi:hypothetical protein